MAGKKGLDQKKDLERKSKKIGLESISEKIFSNLSVKVGVNVF